MPVGKILNTSNALYPNIVRALSGDLVTCQMRSLLGGADTPVQPGGVVVTDVVPFTTAWTAIQGIARNASNWFAIDTTALRKYDLTGALLATNSTPFTGLPTGLDHCGDGFADDNFLYSAISNYSAGLATVKVIAWFNVSDLSLAGYFDLSALPSDFNASGMCKSPDGSEFWVTSYNQTDSDSDSTTKIWRFNSLTGAYIGQHTLGARVVGAQGIAYRPDVSAVYITSWKNPNSRINVYDATTFNLLQIIDPSDINSGEEIEGVICWENDIYTHKINSGPRVLSGNMLIPANLSAGDPVNFLSAAQMGDAGTILMRWRPITLPTLQTVFDNQTNANTWETWVSSAGVLSWRITATTPRCDYSGVVARNEYIIAQTWSKSGSTVEIKLAVNGLYRSTATQNWTALPAGGLWLGGGNAGNSQADAEFLDVLVFDKVLSDAEIGSTFTNFNDLYAHAGGDSFAGTIGKSSNTLSNKTIDVSSGYSSTVDKSTSTISQKQFSVSVGTVLGVGKQTLVLSNKQEYTQLGYVNTLSKLGYTLATKQLSVVVGANLPFTGVLNKTTYSLSGKQLDIVAGWNSGLNIQSLNVEGKQESANLGYVVDINELSIPVIGKPFSIQTGTSISFVGELSKSDLNLAGKPLSVDAGTVIPFIGLLGKTSLSLSGKALSRLNGQILDIQKQSISLVTKQLSIGEIIYPIIPVERLFTIKDKGRTFLFRQTTNIYLIKGK